MAEQRDKNTKQRFSEEALMLFAEKGYEAVSVAQIAEAVGCSAPALYKHYGGKRELLDTIIEEGEKRFALIMLQNNMNLENEETREHVLNMGIDERVERIKEIIKSALHDKFARAFRKMCAVEQFHMPELARSYTRRYFEFQTNQYQILFELLMKQGRLKEADPRTLAISFFSFPLIALEICDREPDREEEMMELIEKHTREFIGIYSVAER